MAVVRWRPLNDMVTVQDEINRAFDDFWRHSRRGGLAAPEAWWPAVDIRENENEFRLVAELPGLTKDDVKISYTDNVLTLRGEKKSETREENENWHQVERSFGAFERSFHLTTPVDPAKVKARFENGVLTVTLPKAENARPREIEIDM